MHEGAGFLRYVRSAEHQHWHFLPFESYELRLPATGELLVRDHKSGFCLGDRYGHQVTRPLPRKARRAFFTGYCESNNPAARATIEGTSVGYTDRYPANYHGQNIVLDGVPAGRYVLVHHANPQFRLGERSWRGNNDASSQIELAWPGSPRRRRRQCTCS